MIAVIDYGMGNIKSVSKALQTVGAQLTITQSPDLVRKARAIVLPGVGAFPDCMKNLANLGLIETIKEEIIKGKPYLGICLGMQILFSESEEFGYCAGLGILKGKVVRFKLPKEYKIPHMGWNTVKFKRENTLIDSIPNNTYFYFVHSYYVLPEDSKVIAATTDYEVEFTSMIAYENIFATQFHPEKSQKMGLKLLENFVKLVK